MTAVSFVGIGARAVSTNANSITPPLPTGLLDGDLVLAWAIIESPTRTYTNPPAGWTYLSSVIDSSGGPGLHIHWKKYATGDADPVLTGTGTSDPGASVVANTAAFRNADTVNGPTLGTSYSSGAATGTTTGTIPGVAVSGNGMSVLFAGWGDDYASVPTVPAGWTVVKADSAGSTSGVSYGSYYQSIASTTSPSATVTGHPTAAATRIGVQLGLSEAVTGPYVRSFTQSQAFNAQGVVAPMPAGVQVGDILYAVVTGDTVNPGDTNPGMEVIGSHNSGGSEANVRVYMAVINATSATNTEWTFITGSSNVGLMTVTLLAVANASTSQPNDAIGNTAIAVGTSTAPAAPSLTPQYADDLLLTSYVIQPGSTAEQIIPPAGMTKVVDANTQFTSVQVSSQQLTSTAATGTKTASIATSAPWVAISLLVRTAGHADTGSYNHEPTAWDIVNITDSVVLSGSAPSATVVGSTTADITSTGTQLSLPAPAGLQVGDTLVAFIGMFATLSSGSPGTIVGPPPGWQVVGFAGDDTYGPLLAVYLLSITSSSQLAGAYNFNTLAGYEYTGHLVRTINVDPTNPIAQPATLWSPGAKDYTVAGSTTITDANIVGSRVLALSAMATSATGGAGAAIVKPASTTAVASTTAALHMTSVSRYIASPGWYGAETWTAGGQVAWGAVRVYLNSVGNSAPQMQVPAFVGSASMIEATTTAITVTVPTGVQTGESLVCFVASTSNGVPTGTIPAGWIQSGWTRTGETTPTSTVVAYYLPIPTGFTPAANYTFPAAGATTALMMRLSGATLTPVEWPLNFQKAGPAQSVTLGTQAGWEPNLMEVIVIVQSALGSAATVTTVPVGMTIIGQNSGAGRKLAVVGVYIANANASASGTFANSQVASPYWAALELPYRPAAAAIQNYTPSATDNVGITDTATPVRTSQRTAADSVGITDSVVASIGHTVTVADNIGITDTASMGVIYAPTPNDVVGITDAVSFTQVANAPPADTIGITDAVTVVLTVARTIADNIGITDAPALSRTANVADNIGITDALTKTTGQGIFIADNIGITDTTSHVAADKISDAVGITDSITTFYVIGRTPADNVGITDAITITQRNVRTAADNIGITDVGTVTGSETIVIRTTADVDVDETDIDLQDVARLTGNAIISIDVVPPNLDVGPERLDFSIGMTANLTHVVAVAGEADVSVDAEDTNLLVVHRLTDITDAEIVEVGLVFDHRFTRRQEEPPPVPKFQRTFTVLR